MLKQAGQNRVKIITLMIIISITIMTTMISPLSPPPSRSHPSFLAHQLMYGRPPLHWNFIITHTPQPPHTLITTIIFIMNIIIPINIIVVIIIITIIIIITFSTNIFKSSVQDLGTFTSSNQPSILRRETRICGNQRWGVHTYTYSSAAYIT